MYQKIQHKKAYAFITFTNSIDKILEIWNVTDAKTEINKFQGGNCFQDACEYLLEMKKKNLEGIFFDLYDHEDSDFLVKLRKNFMDFCSAKKILFRWIFYDILFSTMLLYFSEVNFQTEDTVITVWIKNDYYVFHKLHDEYLTEIDRIKLNDKKFEDKFDNIVKVKEPKFVVMGSTTVQKLVKGHLKTKEVKMVKNTFLQCLQKSAGYLLGQMLRSQKCRWNFKVQLFNAFIVDAKCGINHHSISSSSIDSLPNQSTLDLPKVVTSIRGSSKFTFGRHISFHSETKITVEVDEDGFIHFFLPKSYASSCFGRESLDFISYKNTAFMEDFVYVTASDPHKEILEVWKIVNRRLCKKQFSGNSLFKDVNSYLMELRKTSLDAIILNLYQHSDPEFLWTARRHFKTFCERQKLSFKFISQESLLISFLLLKSKLNLNRFLTINIGYLYDQTTKILQVNTSPTKIEVDNCDDYSDAESGHDYMNFLTNLCTRENDFVILSLPNDHTLNLVFDVFSRLPLGPKNDAFKRINEDFEQCFISSSTALFLQMFNNKSFKWNLILPTSPCTELSAESRNEFDYAIYEEEVPAYPCTKSVKIPKKALRLHVERDFGKGFFVEYSELNKDKVTFDVAEDGFTHFYYPSKFAAFDGGSMIYKEMATKLNATVTNRKPVIVFPEDIAILFVYENGTYAPININGRKEIRMVISFAEEDPEFGNAAIETRINDDKSAVVEDLMKIIKMDPQNIVKKDYWGFEIVHHEKYPLLFEFQTTDGLTHAPPSFLLAMIIKQMTKAYRKKTGHKLKDVMVLDIFQNNNAIKHIKGAFQLMRVKCTFFQL